MNADLHCHSTCSDGTLAPAALAARAAAGGVTLWALTDHDELSGIAEARQAAHAHGLDFVTGCEVSVTFLNKTVHIVGLGVDEHDAALLAGLEDTRDGRTRRAREMAQGLQEAGIEGAFEGALRYVGNPDLMSRTHFARHLVDSGVCADVSEVFRRFLVEGKPGYVPHRWATLEDALGWITGAGGIAVLAHPARYGFDTLQEDLLFDRFTELGGRAVEVITSAHDAADEQKYAQIARRRGLMASRGSDFHAPGEGRIELGSLPALPTGLSPVWEALEARVQRA